MDGDRLAEMLADAVAAEAARDRAKERMLRRAAEEEATLCAALLQLGERRDRVSLHLAGGRVHRGIVSAVARDFVVVVDDHDRPVAIAIAAITTLRQDGSARTRGDTAGTRDAPLGTSMAAFLSGIAPDRLLVQIGLGAEEPLLGTLRSVGEDVVTVELESADRQVVLIPLHAVSDVVLLDS